MKEQFQRVVEARPWLVMLWLMALHLLVAGLGYTPVPHAGGDNTAYLALARSLLDHGQYLELWEPGRPPHTQYPPGFPMILAVAWVLGLKSWAALKAMMMVITTAAVGVSYLWMRERAEPAVALGLGLLLAVAPGLAAEGAWVLSDMPFWLVTVGGLLALERGRAGWAIGLAFAALLIRTAGLPLVLAVAAWLALRRRWKAAAGVLGALAVIGVLWSIRAPDPAVPYVSQFWYENWYRPELGRVGFVGLIERMVENAGRYSFQILMRTLTGSSGTVAAAGGVAIVAAAVIGFVASALRAWDTWWGNAGDEDAEGEAAAEAKGGSARQDAEERTAAGGSQAQGAIEIFALLYGGVVLLWPAQWASDRFLIPLVPVLLVYAAEGLGAVLTARFRRVARWAALVAILGLSVPQVADFWSLGSRCRDAVEDHGFLACLRPSHQSFVRLAMWSAGQLPEDAVVVSRKPRQWYWYSGHPGLAYPFSPEGNQLLETARGAEAKYVVVDRLGGSARIYLIPAIQEQPRWYCAIHQIGQGAQGATLLGVLEDQWPAGLFGDPPESQARQRLRLPLCPASYRAQGGE